MCNATETQTSVDDSSPTVDSHRLVKQRQRHSRVRAIVKVSNKFRRAANSSRRRPAGGGRGRDARRVIGARYENRFSRRYGLGEGTGGGGSKEEAASRSTGCIPSENLSARHPIPAPRLNLLPLVAPRASSVGIVARQYCAEIRYRPRSRS